MAFYFDIMEFEDPEFEGMFEEADKLIQHGPFDTEAEAEEARKTYCESQWAPSVSHVYED